MYSVRGGFGRSLVGDICECALWLLRRFFERGFCLRSFWFCCFDFLFGWFWSSCLALFQVRGMAIEYYSRS